MVRLSRVREDSLGRAAAVEEVVDEKAAAAAKAVAGGSPGWERREAKGMNLSLGAPRCTVSKGAVLPLLLLLPLVVLAPGAYWDIKALGGSSSPVVARVTELGTWVPEEEEHRAAAAWDTQRTLALGGQSSVTTVYVG